MKRPMRVATTRCALAGAALVLGLAGCSYTNEPTVLQQYDAGDGVSTTLEDTLLVRNWVVVTNSREGRQGQFVGTVINRGARTATLTVQVAPGASGQPTQARLQVPGAGQVQLGPQQDTELAVPNLSVPAGGLLEVSVATAGGGSDVLAVPVLLAQDYYSSYGPQAPARPTQSPRPAATTNDPIGEPAAENESPAPTGVVPTETAEPESRTTVNP